MSTVTPAALRTDHHRYDIVVAGGGMAGIGAAITAARHGARVALVQDRPVLGGNASKEIRVNIAGATGGENACFWRETGLLEEILLEHLRQNPDCVPELWDILLTDKVRSQKGLDLFLNTSVMAVDCESVRRDGYASRIRSVRALTLQNEIESVFEADYFIDCTGDGTLAFLAGAPFMIGHESRDEFGESLAPEKHRNITMGSSAIIMAKDMGHPVEFHPPSFAYKFTEKDFRPGRNPVWEFDQTHYGFWYVERGGTQDTVHDTEAINLEILRIAYGVFDYLKNDPSQREKNRNYTLEFVSPIGGKRESRRFVGDHVLRQQDVIERPDFPDAVAYGGWNMDDHAPEGFFDDHCPASFHRHIPGLYNIPLRCLYSKTVENLFFAGRNASVTHLALTSTRVMATCQQMGEAAGMAAVVCRARNLTPRSVANGPAIQEVQQRLLRDDHSIIGLRSDDALNLARLGNATVRASSQMPNIALDEPNRAVKLDKDFAVLFAALAGDLPYVDVLLSTAEKTRLGWQLHRADGRGLTIPIHSVAEGCVDVEEGGTQWVRLPVAAHVSQDDWHVLELKRNPAVQWHATDDYLAGVRAMFPTVQQHQRGANQFSRFRRDSGQLWTFCLRTPPDARLYAAANVINGMARPFKHPNLWISRKTAFAEPEWLEIELKRPAKVAEVILVFDSELDVRINHYGRLGERRVLPALVKDYELQLRRSGKWETVCSVRDNHQRRRVHAFEPGAPGEALRLLVKSTHGAPRAHVYEMRIYEAAVADHAR